MEKVYFDKFTSYFWEVYPRDRLAVHHFANRSFWVVEIAVDRTTTRVVMTVKRSVNEKRF